MWPLLDSVLNPTMPMKDKLTYLNLVNHVHKLRLEKETEVNMLKEKIQELISSPMTRFEGYLFMEALMSNDPTAYINNWGPIIIGSLKCSESFVSKQLTLRILKHVVVNFSGNATCSEAFHRFIPEILPMLLEVEQTDQGFLYCCQALAICMQRMPVIIGPHCDEIEAFLLKHMETLSFGIVEVLTDCFAALPICIASFRKPKPKAKDVWLEVYVKTLNTLQALLNDIFKFPEVENYFVSVEGRPLFKIEFNPNEEEFTQVFSRIRMFSALCSSLAKMMSVRLEPNSEITRVHVPVQELLQCLERIFKVKRIIKLKQMPKCTAFALGYPLMQGAVLSVLEALIVNFTIIEQSGNFAKLLKQSMEATALATFTHPDTLRAMRSNTWKTLNIWLKQYGAKGAYEIVNDRFLVRELLKDVSLDSENLHPQLDADEELPVDTYTENCCFEALQVVENIFTTGGSYMERDIAEEISATILKTVRKIQLHLHPAKKFPYPYTNENCRLKLYDSLLSGSIFVDPLQTKLINQAIHIFKFAMKDPNMEINTICHKAFKICRCFLNPRKPPPESVTSLEMAKAVPVPLEENVETGWESGDWNLNNESSQEDKSMDVTSPFQIESVYQNSVENDGQRDLGVQSTKSPIHYSEAHESQSQCNGDNSRSVSNKPPSHSNVCNDSESDEIEEYKEYSLEEPHIIAVDIPPIAPTPIINSIESQVSEPKITNPDPKIIELRPLEPIISENATTANHHDSSVADAPDECTEVVEEDIIENQPRMRERMAENGMDVESEEEETGDEEDEEGTGSDDDEEGNETYPSPDRTYTPQFYHPDKEANSGNGSPVYYNERPVKRRKISNEEERSSEDCEDEKSLNQNQEMANQDEESEDDEVKQSDEDDDDDEEEEEEELPNGSPTVSEMCRDFVLAEPEEIS